MENLHDLTGGCACGAVRYRLTATPYDAGWCHCRLCQRSSGAPALAFVTVLRKDFVVEQGGDVVTQRASTSFGRRSFCTKCGTQLTVAVTFQPDEIDVTLASLDDPGSIAPSFHIFYTERPVWHLAADNLPKYAGWRPDTRGLASSGAGA